VSAVAVAVISFNTREHLRTCLATALAERPAELLVADNGSTDGSVEMVREAFPGVVLDVDASNPGYGAACNRAVARCAAPYVLLLNSDTLLRAGALAALAGYLDAHARAGLVGPRLLNPDGTLQRSTFRFPTPLFPVLRHSPTRALARHVPLLRERHLGTWSHAWARPVPWVVGAALAVRRDAFEAIGGFDETFYMYCEEIDLSYRLRLAGWETHFAPVTDVVHVGGASTGQYRASMRAHLCVSAVRFYERHYTGVRRAVGRGVVRGQTLARWARDGARLRLTSDECRRRELAADVDAWRQALVATRVPR
jgi:GT2 family glycosyltransferase